MPMVPGGLRKLVGRNQKGEHVIKDILAVIGGLCVGGTATALLALAISIYRIKNDEEEQGPAGASKR